MLEFNQGKQHPIYISEKHNSNDILYDIEIYKIYKKMKNVILNHILYKIQQSNIIIKSKKWKKMLLK